MKNKKILITAIIAIVIVAITGVTCASWLDIKADTPITVTSGDWSPNANNLTFEPIMAGDNTTITSYRLVGFKTPMKGTYVNIPSVYETKPVTHIAASFTSNGSVGDYLIKVIIPASVTTIEANAFSDMKLLNEVVFAADGITEIGANAFNRCDKLTTITIPSTITTIGSKVLFHCPTLDTIKVMTKAININGGKGTEGFGVKANDALAKITYAK